MTKIILIMAVLIGNEISYSEYHGFDTFEQCWRSHALLTQMYKLADGVTDGQIKGACYRVVTP